MWTTSRHNSNDIAVHKRFCRATHTRPDTTPPPPVLYTFVSARVASVDKDFLRHGNHVPGCVTRHIHSGGRNRLMNGTIYKTKNNRHFDSTEVYHTRRRTGYIASRDICLFCTRLFFFFFPRSLPRDFRGGVLHTDRERWTIASKCTPKKGLSEEVDKSISIASQRDRLKKKERNINYLLSMYIRNFRSRTLCVSKLPGLYYATPLPFFFSSSPDGCDADR